MSNSRVLLDKNVTREILEGLEKNAQGIELDERQQLALETLQSELFAGKRLFIVSASDNILSLHYATRAEVRFLKSYVEVIIPTRYYKRWSRRLRGFGFAREDANVLGHGTFGTDDEQKFVGVDEILTFDKPLVNLFQEKHDPIQKKLDALKRNIESPYDQAKLPTVKLLDPSKGKSRD